MSAKDDPATARGLLYVHMNPPAGGDDEFNAWYDQHGPARLTMPGFLSAIRYQAVGPDGPRYLAWYDLEDVSTLEGTEYRKLREAERPGDLDLMGRITLVDRRVYRALDVGEPWTAPWTEQAQFIVSMTMDPPPDKVEDYHQWYLQEHIPMLFKVPGWRRIRRFEQVGPGTGVSFLAIHELESLDAFNTDEFRAAVGTPWRDRVLGYVGRRERLTFQLLRSYPRPS